jgi:hypothetical protein
MTEIRNISIAACFGGFVLASQSFRLPSSPLKLNWEARRYPIALVQAQREASDVNSQTHVEDRRRVRLRPQAIRARPIKVGLNGNDSRGSTINCKQE